MVMPQFLDAFVLFCIYDAKVRIFSETTKLFSNYFAIFFRWLAGQAVGASYPLTHLPTYDRKVWLDESQHFLKKLTIKAYYYIYYNIYNNKTIISLNCTFRAP